MNRRRRPREFHTTTAAALLGLAFSRSMAEALRPPLPFAGAAPGSGAAVLVQQQRCAPLPRSEARTAPPAARPGGRHDARFFRLQAAGHGAALGQAEGDDEPAASSARNTPPLIQQQQQQQQQQQRIAAGLRTAATEEGQQTGVDPDEEAGGKRTLLRRARRRANAKIKAVPAGVLDASAAAGANATRGLTNTASSSGSGGVSGGGGGGGGGGPTNGGSVGEVAARVGSGESRGTKEKTARRRGGTVGAVCGAVIGTPARFVRERVDTCKQFVKSRERVHWANLAMAAYIFTTSVVPRLPTGTGG